MNIVLWIIQAVLALLFLFAGGSKATLPVEKVKKQFPFSNQYGIGFTRFLGVAEVLGALGLILPGLTHILPWLTIAAAVGLAIAMISAVIYHASKRETQGIGMTVVLSLLLLLIIVGRLVLSPL